MDSQGSTIWVRAYRRTVADDGVPMEQLAETFAKHRKRLDRIMTVLGRYGLAGWADRDSGTLGIKVAQHFADPALTSLPPRSSR